MLSSTLALFVVVTLTRLRPCNARFYAEYDHAIDILEISTQAFFLKPALGVLEPLRVTARTVRNNVGEFKAENSFVSLLHQNGWFWQAPDESIEKVMKSLRESCFEFLNGASLSERYSWKSCLVSHFESRPSTATALVNKLKQYIEQVLSSSDLDVECSDDPSQWVLFSREGSDPQNMHYDTVAMEQLQCSEITPAAGNGTMYIRAWMPVTDINVAPLLLANTTNLYGDACPRRESFHPEQNQSASWKIFSRDDFLTDCAMGEYGVCSWFHTLGMIPGEILFFRNGMLIHGTGSWGHGVRSSLSVDCITKKQKS